MNSINQPSAEVELCRDPAFMQIRVLWGHCSCHQVLAAFPMTLISHPCCLRCILTAATATRFLRGCPTSRLTLVKLPPTSLPSNLWCQSDHTGLLSDLPVASPACRVISNLPPNFEAQHAKPFPTGPCSPSASRLTAPSPLLCRMLQHPVVFQAPKHTSVLLPASRGHPSAPVPTSASPYSSDWLLGSTAPGGCSALLQAELGGPSWLPQHLELISLEGRNSLLTS